MGFAPVLLPLLAACEGEDSPSDLTRSFTFAFDRDATGDQFELYSDGLLVQSTEIDGSSTEIVLEERPEEFATIHAAVTSELGVFFGICDEYLMWLGREPTDDESNSGWNKGWNVMIDVEQELPVAQLESPIPFVLDLVPSETATLGGTFAAKLSAPDYGLALVPLADLNLTYLTISSADPWMLTSAAGPPPEAHLDAVDSAGWTPSHDSVEAAVELPIAFVDSDASGSRSSDEEAAAWGVVENDHVALLWVAPAAQWESAWNAHWVGAGTGWHAVRLDYWFLAGPLDQTDAASVVLDTVGSPNW